MVAEREPALVAHPPSVDRLVLARPEAPELLALLAMPHIQVHVAARATQGADALRVPHQIPGPGLKAVLPTRQGAHRTEVDHVSGIRVVQHLPRKQIDLGPVSAGEDTQLPRLGNLVTEKNTARAQDE